MSTAEVEELGDTEWFERIQYSPSFTNCDWGNPAKSTDFGSDGYTASVTDQQELLQLTSPDEICGLVFVRGDFPNTADAILSRAQRRDFSGQKGTFGIQLHPDSEYELGPRHFQGLINLRWPYMQYLLKRKGADSEPSGILEEISFVRDGTVFQLLRVTMRKGKFLRKKKIKFKVGGRVQFGCPCSNGSPAYPGEFEMIRATEKARFLCLSAVYKKRLEMQFFVKGCTWDLEADAPSNEKFHSSDGFVDLSYSPEVEFQLGGSGFLLSTFKLRHYSVDSILNKSCLSGVADYLGISHGSLAMSDRLWTACTTENYTDIEATEICAVGKCVEQVLCVSSLPYPPLEQFPSDLPPKLGIALVKNIITTQYVDLQSTFWQIRLLIKAHRFLQTRKLQSDTHTSPMRPLDEVRDSYLIMLQNHIRSVLICLLNENYEQSGLLLPWEDQLRTRDLPMPDSFRIKACESHRDLKLAKLPRNEIYFVTLCLWYAIKYCPEAITLEFKTRHINRNLNKLARLSDFQESWGDADSTPKTDILQWFHLTCLLLIYNEVFDKDDAGQDLNGYQITGANQQDFYKAQQKCQKYITRLQPNQSEAYSMEHEELDRLVLVGEELGFDSLEASSGSSSLASARASKTRIRISKRISTTRFNPGPSAYRTDKRSQVVSNGPWELACLNHHSQLRVAAGWDRSSQHAIKLARDRCFEFLLSDYSFMSTWDRADGAMVGKWWDFEPASVICATIIDLKIQGKLDSAKAEVIENLSRSRTAESFASQLMDQQEDRDAGNPWEGPQSAEVFQDLVLQLEQVITNNKSGTTLPNKAFDWMVFKPDYIYHPPWWIQSLDDTPEVYKLKQTKDVPLRREILRYLANGDAEQLVNPPDWTMDNIKHEIPPTDVQFLSVFDLQLNEDFTFSIQKSSLESSSSTVSPAYSLSRRSKDNGDTTEEITQDQNLKRARDLNPLEKHQVTLFDRLNDSLVDLGTKYRILFAQRCCPSTVKAFIYMWHPDALDTFDNYFGNSSRFADNRETTWVSSITISHWSVRSAVLSQEVYDKFKEHRSTGDFPPESIAKLGFSKASKQSTLDVVEEGASSLVITGDQQGFLWTCSIWSPLTDHTSLAPTLQSLPQVLQVFINQQASGRCLVFLILLGHLCERLADEYSGIISTLDRIVELGEKVLLEGLDWEASNAISKLKRMLWGLEALRVFDDRLSASLTEIQKARETLDHTIKLSLGSHPHIDLLQEYNNIIEGFGKRYVILTSVQVRIQLKIKQVTGLQGSISTVTNVEDSRTALRDSRITIKQGNNIRVLTLITIAYLPLSFVAALFSMAHGILPDDAGNTLFAVLMAVFIVCTYTLALYLETILEYLDLWLDRVKGITEPRERRQKGDIRSNEVEEITAETSGSSANGRGGRRKESGDVELGNIGRD